ncbi:Glycerol-3-phosphate 2-O-acyltransferase 6 [Capsicum annuum]|nr:Glycerol-3-phosphate 2-O-acyltransferase 6 [Capsicum annuum]
MVLEILSPSLSASRGVRARIESTFMPDHTVQSDFCRRSLTGNGIFTCKFTYQHISTKRVALTRSNLHLGWIWKARVPNKLKFFLWLVHHNGLPTKATLAHKGWPHEDLLLRSEEEVEEIHQEAEQKEMKSPHEQEELSPFKNITRKLQMKKGTMAKAKILASYMEEVKNDLLKNLDQEYTSDMSISSAGDCLARDIYEDDDLINLNDVATRKSSTLFNRGREKDTVVAELDGTLLRSRTTFAYFALVAFDVYGVLRDESFCYRIGGTCSATKVQPEIGLGDCDTDVPFMTLCKEGYFVPSKPKVKAITVDKLPKPIIFHDGRLVQKPTPLMALLIILWIPFGFVLSCVRISIGSLLPISLYHYASWPSGIRLIIKGIPPSPIMKSEDKCSLRDRASGSKMSTFHPTTARGWKGMDLFYFFMDPSPIYEVTFLNKLSPELTGKLGKPSHEVANYIQRAIATTLSYECTNFTRKDKYRALAGNDGTIEEKGRRFKAETFMGC